MPNPVVQGRLVKESLGSAARTANGNLTLSGDFSQSATFVAQLNVTAASGTTPTLNVVIEDTLDGTNWYPVATFTQATGVGTQVQRVNTAFGTQLRARWTVGGTTPNFTFDVLVHAR